MSKDRPMSFWEHIDELIRRLKVVLYTLAISTIAMMVLPANIFYLNQPGLYEPLVALILRVIRDQVLPSGVKLVGMELVAPIELYLIASFFFGLAVTAPIMAYEIFRFIDPALYPHERRDVYPFLTSFIVLFAIGLVFGYLVLVPYGLAALIPFFHITGAELYISITSFYYFVFFLTLMTGLMFTFPVFLTLLVKYGIIQTQLLTRNRRYVYVALIILVFLVTPGEGGLANFMLLIVMITLLESGILFARRYEKKGEVRHPRWFTEEAKCKFCREKIPENETFCPNCRKSQK